MSSRHTLCQPTAVSLYPKERNETYRWNNGPAEDSADKDEQGVNLVTFLPGFQDIGRHDDVAQMNHQDLSCPAPRKILEKSSMHSNDVRT